MSTPSVSAAQQSAARETVIDAAQLARLADGTISGPPLLAVSDDSLEFGRLTNGCFTANGAAVVLSVAPRGLVVLPPNSVGPARMIGKGGSGPGELEQPWLVSCFGADSAAVLELARVTTVDLSRGQFATTAVQPLQHGHLQYVVARLSHGRVLLRRNLRPTRLLPGAARDSVELLVAGPDFVDGAEASPLVRVPGEEVVRIPAGRGGMTTAGHPFGRTLLVGASDSGVYLMDTGTPVLRRFSPAGVELQRARFSWPPRVLSRGEQTRYRTDRLDRARSLTERAATDRWLAATPMPTTLPYFDRLVPLSDGGVLLRLFTLDGDATTRWLMMDAELQAVARLSLPSDMRVLAASAQHILGVRADDEGTTLEYTHVLLRHR